MSITNTTIYILSYFVNALASVLPDVNLSDIPIFTSIQTMAIYAKQLDFIIPWNTFWMIAWIWIATELLALFAKWVLEAFRLVGNFFADLFSF